MLTAEHIITMLALMPLPEEGGYYRQTYQGDLIGGMSPGGPRAIATTIYYLVTGDDFSAMHRLPADEIFHHYLGDPAEQLHLLPDGSGRIVRLGPDLLSGERPQVIAPGGCWQGTRVIAGGRHGYALLGTSMAPGFRFADYEGGRRADLVASYPAFRAMIEELTRV